MVGRLQFRPRLPSQFASAVLTRKPLKISSVVCQDFLIKIQVFLTNRNADILGFSTSEQGANGPDGQAEFRPRNPERSSALPSRLVPVFFPFLINYCVVCCA